MSVELTSLIRLERLDTEIARLEKSKQEYPKKVQEMLSTLGMQESVSSKATTKKEQFDSDVSRTENDLIEQQEKLKNSHSRLSLVKTNREYDAVLLEINEWKDAIEKSRKKLDKLYEREESIVVEAEKAAEELQTVSVELQPQIDDLSSKIASIDDDIAKVVETRDQAILEIPKNYARLRQSILQRRKNGRFLSVVSQETKACTYCYQVLSPNIQKRVQSSDTLVVCENCGTVFIWEHKSPTSEESGLV